MVKQKSWGRRVAAMALVMGGALALAQSSQALLEGVTLDNQPVMLDKLKGKVIFLTFWTTESYNARATMYELRQNYKGWAGQPFELVAVNIDPKSENLNSFMQITAVAAPVKERFPILWAGQPGYKDTFSKSGKMPVSYVIDKQGNVVKRFEGPVPPDAWNDIADLL